MPEGPSIVIMREETANFAGQKIIGVDGNSKIDLQRFEDQTILAIKSWGKHYLICFADCTIRIHLLLFGSYRINERKETPARLRLTFDDGELNFYGCSVQILEGDINDHYDWTADVMNPKWDPKKAMKKMALKPQRLICDTLLEQDVFAGVGNIIKNEVLYRVRVHPESATGSIPKKKLREITEESRIYSFEFLEWKKQFVLKKHWLAHAKKICLRCNLPLIKTITGVKKRRSFYCTKCQKLHQ